MANSLFTTFASVKKRIALSDERDEEPKYRGKLYRFIRAFLAVSVVALFIEIFAYFNQWHLNLVNPWEEDRQLSMKMLVILRRSYFPMVLVQIPMCNEKEVFAQSIGAVCQLDWPKDRFLVQVLDDSDDEVLQQMIRNECLSWKEKGDYEFVAIFDADFQPNPDFLKLTVPHFKGKPDVGLVQARWTFVNKDENLLTRLQNINLCFHFEVEQQVNGHYLNFFGFNGTAGVWRIKALEESGGWLERTTVEDMDIAVRAHLCGWKFIYVNDLFRLCLPTILTSKISVWKKANMIFLSSSIKEADITFTHSHCSDYFSWAVPPEWVVTKKTGRSSESDLLAFAERESKNMNEEKISRRLSESGLELYGKLKEHEEVVPKKKKANKIYRKELALAFLFAHSAAARSLLSAQGIHFYYLVVSRLNFSYSWLGFLNWRTSQLTKAKSLILYLVHHPSV
ncbi:hypothetical protein HAX54_051551 [Datura stramonium]|uniref:Glycosyltransferase 2-like domain-containing protein n=1 Tax=Datura stramonium TaxID=4076 RepID=A0ABS8SYD2_DATST|nr:hypothetical protein [Datura stramonium]